MQSLRNTEPDVIGSRLPADTAPRSGWDRAFAELNAVAMTCEQIGRGYSSAVKLEPELDGQLNILATWASCEADSLLPADVTAEAIVVRGAPVLDAGFKRGIEIFEGGPPYANISIREVSVSQHALQFIG